jgi:hypothetical protein
MAVTYMYNQFYLGLWLYEFDTEFRTGVYSNIRSRASKSTHTDTHAHT